MGYELLKRFRVLIAVTPLVFLGIFYFYPLIRIFALSFTPEGMWGMGEIRKLFTTAYYLQILWFTTWQAAVSTVLTIVLALPGAYIFARYRFPGKGLLQSLTTVPFVLPSVVVAAAFHALLGEHGIANDWLVKTFTLATPPFHLEHTVWLILIAHVYYNYSVVVRIVGGFWSRLEPRLTEAAHMLGASTLKAFFRITLPLLWPSLLASGLLVFVFCFSSFGTVLILGGPRFATIEVEIYRQAVNIFNLPMAGVLSLFQILCTFAFMWIYTWLQRKTTVPLTPGSRALTQRRVITLQDRLFVGANVGLILILLGAPLFALVFRSFSTEEGFSFDFYRALFENPSESVFFVPPIEAIFNSVGFACATLVMALVLGLLAAQTLATPKGRLTSILDPLFMLPLATSPVILGFGFIIALDTPPLNLRTSLMLVPLAHTLVAYAFVLRSALPALRSIPRGLRDAAALLGASPVMVWRKVDLPIVTRAIVVGAVFAFTVSLGEFGATVFVARPQTPTIPLAIYRFLGQPGAINYGQAMAMSTILMVVTVVGFVFLEKLRIGERGEF